MGYKCGLVGFPNVGKSTLFNLLTNTRKAKVGNFPFCTIEPNSAKVPFIDDRLNQLAKKNNSIKTLYSILEFVDIAGLVKNASKGEGLGNKFLSHIAEVDLIIHVVRCFQDDGITHIMNRIDPLDDLQTIFTELVISDLNKVENLLKKHKKGDENVYLLDVQNKLMNNQAIIDNFGFSFLSAKPIIVLGNGEEKSLLNPLIEFCKKNNLLFVSLPIEFLESIDLDELTEVDKNEMLKDVTQLIQYGFSALGLITYFTTGPQESRSWTITKGDNALDAASKIHTDIAKRFIAAEITSFNDYIKGITFKLKGKDHIIEDGDVILFRHNA